MERPVIIIHYFLSAIGQEMGSTQRSMFGF